MRFLHLQHLQWVLLFFLFLNLDREVHSAGEETVRQVTAPNGTTEKDLSPLKFGNGKITRPLDSVSDGINAVPLSPAEDVKIKESDRAVVVGSRSSDDEKAKSLKEPLLEKSDRIPKNLNTPSVNAVVSDSDVSSEEKSVKRLEINVTEPSVEEDKVTTKSASDDLAQYDYLPKGKTVSYDKDNSTGGDNSDVLKNTVPSEPKVVKPEENAEKEGERWIKKQRGVSSPSQSTTEFKTRANKERNLSGSYLPALAVLNAVNSSSESETNNDKFHIKYQRRKRPWSAQINSSDLNIPEETTVWSLASLKATPREKYGETKPVIPWSTVLNKPITEFASSPPSTATPLPDKNTESGSTSKVDEVGAQSIRAATTPSDSTVKSVESNLTSPSTSLNLIDASPDKESSNQTSNDSKTEEPIKNINDSKSVDPNKILELSNVIKKSDTTVKVSPVAVSSGPVSFSPTTTENVKNLSVFSSPLSNSVNELNEESNANDSGPPELVRSSQKGVLATHNTVSRVTPPTTRLSLDTETESSSDNSDHPDASKMFYGKESYASSFNFSSPSPTDLNKINSTIKPEIEVSAPRNVTDSIPTEEPSAPSVQSNKTTAMPPTSTIDKIVHVTSTMLPDKGKDSLKKGTSASPNVSASTESSNIRNDDFSLGLFDMFNISKEIHSPSVSPTTIASDKILEVSNSTTSQPKEFNEIPLDVDKVVITTERNVKPVTSGSVSALPTSSEHPIKEVSKNFDITKTDVEEKTNENINTIEPLEVTEKINQGKITSTGKDSGVTGLKDEIKLVDLFNSTEDTVASTDSKLPVYTVDKVSSTSEEPQINLHSEEDTLSGNETSPVTSEESNETERDNQSENRTPDLFSFPVDNISKSEEETTPKFFQTTEEAPKTALYPEPKPNNEAGDSKEEESDRYPSSEEDVIYDGADPVFTRLLVQANDKELCSRKEQLRDSIIRLLETNGSEIDRKQVAINNLGMKDCLMRNPPSDDGLFPIQVYLMDPQGHNDMLLTDKFIDLWQRHGLDFSYPVKRVDKIVGRNVEVEKSEGNSSLIAAIVISAIAAVCLLFIVILLVIIRKRQKGFNYGQRCTPVSLEDYSLDNISVYNSTRRKAARASKRSYGNPAFDDPGAISHVVNFATLANFCNNRSMIDEEFTQIPTVSVKPDELPPGVEMKNRFANVIPIPETRVTLASTRGNNPEVDSYINANFVKGSKGEEKFYIACQAPMLDTVSDFWQMIWEQQSRLIIMLTDLQEGSVEKCADYLPPSEVLDCHRVFGDLQVTLKKREVREKYVISNLQLKNLENNLWREVVHLWLTSWPQQGVPSDPTAVIAFLIEARSYIKSKENDSPIVVHCSPGTGRTGTIIAIDICIRDFEVKRTIDVPKTVCNIRKDRAGAVQTKDQYAFIYQVLHLYATKLTGGGLDSI